MSVRYIIDKKVQIDVNEYDRMPYFNNCSSVLAYFSNMRRDVNLGIFLSGTNAIF